MSEKVTNFPLKEHLMSPAIDGYYGTTPGQIRMVQAFAAQIANEMSESDVRGHLEQISKDQLMVLKHQCDTLKLLATEIAETK